MGVGVEPELSATPAFDAFVAARYRALVRTAALLVGDHGLGEDLVQESLVRTFGAWSRLRDPANAEAYTRATMLRLAARARRRRWHAEVPTAEPATSTSKTTNTPDTADPVHQAQQIRSALLRLPWQQRAVLVLRYFDDQSEASVAAVLGCSVGTVKSRARRGLAALRTAGVLDDEQWTEVPRGRPHA